MTLIRTSSELIVNPINVLASDEMVVASARVSTIGVDSMSYIDTPAEESAGLIRFLMSNRHGTPFEHNMFTFFVKAPIKVYREWHRHRIGQSYNEESGRYKQLEPEFYIPPPHRPMHQTPGSKPGQYDIVGLDMENPDDEGLYWGFVETYTKHYQDAYNLYERALERNIPKEVARDCLPVTIYSSMWVTMNSRSLMSFLQLRRKIAEAYWVQSEEVSLYYTKNPGGAMFPSKPMWEIDECAKKLEAVFADYMPITYAAFVANGYVAP